MTKEEYQGRIAEIICNKPEEITCEECHRVINRDICKGFTQCRISEKTAEQLEYVMMPKEENVFLKACAGSGKTEVLGLKAAYEIKQWKSYNQGIAVLTFTNDATNVIIDRIKQFTNRNNTYPHYIGTLSSFVHSYIVQPFCYKLQDFKGKDGDFSFRIIDRNLSIYKNHWLETYKCQVSYIDSQGRWNPILAHQMGYDFEKKDFYFYVGKNKMEWLSEYYASTAMQAFIQSKRVTSKGFWKEEYVTKCFQNCKKEFWRDGFATFDDFNFLAAKILSKDMGKVIAERFPIIFIDECQDLSGNELKVLRLLQKQGCSIHCIGDLNQSIYEFKRVEPNEITEYVNGYKKKGLNVNFRSCKEIVDFSEKLIGSRECISVNKESQFGDNALLYIEYENPEETIEKYINLLKKYNFIGRDNRILVRQNSLRLQLESATCNDYDEKEPLIVALQLWGKGSQQQMSSALELAGRQISRWFGGAHTKTNYYCPKEIISVFHWRIFLMNVLKDILQSKNLSDFGITYGKWHEYARKELGEILEKNYSVLAAYDEVGNRNLAKLIEGKNFRVSNGNGKVIIGEFNEKKKNAIPIMTIHKSKGCTFDSTLVISSKNAKSIGGHWKEHWLNGSGESKRIGYVASTRARHLLVWGVPKLKRNDKDLIESYGFINVENLL